MKRAAIGLFGLAMALTSFHLSADALQVQAATVETGTVRAGEPSISGFSTAEQLTNPGKFSLLKANGGIAQKVRFGRDVSNAPLIWYIAGAQLV